MTKVITYGSFDLFHEGHYNLLKNAKALGDYLVVGVTTEQYDISRDKLNVNDSLMERIENVRKTGLADEIIVEDHAGQKIDDIQRLHIDIFAIGSDWTDKFNYLRRFCEVVYLPRTKNISSTILRNAPDKVLRLGLIGNGSIASRFVPESRFVSGVFIESVYNPNVKSAQKFAKRFEIDAPTDDFGAFLQSVDAVYIASPHETHVGYARRCLLGGKHVLCEKPLAFTAGEAAELFALADEKNLLLMEAIKTAYAPGFAQLLAIARSGSIGEIRDVEASFTHLTLFDAAGSMAALGSYPLLAICKLLGTDYKSVEFECMVNEQGVDQYTKMHMRYARATATGKVGMGVKSEGQLLISGTQGYILCPSPWWQPRHFDVCYEVREQNEHYYNHYKGFGLRYELADFMSAIRSDDKKNYKLTPAESIAIAGVFEKFRAKQNIHAMPY